MKLVFIALTLLSTDAVAGSACAQAPDDFMLFDTTPQAKEAGIDYPTELIGALLKKQTSLVALFQVTPRLDGSGAQAHGGVLWAALECWGDQDFSSVLATQSAELQLTVLKELDCETEEAGGYAKSFPKTHALKSSASNNQIQPTPKSGAAD